MSGDENRLRNWAHAYQRLATGVLGDRAHTACIDDFAADDGEYPYITAEDVLALLGEIDFLRMDRDAWRDQVLTIREQQRTALAERDAAQAKVARIERLTLVAEERDAASLSRTFGGGTFGAWVSGQDIRSALIDRDHYVCHRDGDKCEWDGCPNQHDGRACEGCFLGQDQP